jgi:hypothetical protein
MQNRYTGDIGDYVKLAILRALMHGRRLGVGWWLYPDESHNSDGRHISYLSQPEVWRRFDPALFDHLKAVVISPALVTCLPHGSANEQQNRSGLRFLALCDQLPRGPFCLVIGWDVSCCSRKF